MMGNREFRGGSPPKLSWRVSIGSRSQSLEGKEKEGRKLKLNWQKQGILGEDAVPAATMQGNVGDTYYTKPLVAGGDWKESTA